MRGMRVVNEGILSPYVPFRRLCSMGRIWPYMVDFTFVHIVSS